MTTDVIMQTIGLAIIWTIPVAIVGMKMRRNEIPKRNFLLLTNILYWMAIVLDAIAQIQYAAGLNLVLADPNYRVQWAAFLWPISFASSLSGFFVSNDRKEHLYAAAKLLLSFLLLVTRGVSFLA